MFWTRLLAKLLTDMKSIYLFIVQVKRNLIYDNENKALSEQNLILVRRNQFQKIHFFFHDKINRSLGNYFVQSKLHEIFAVKNVFFRGKILKKTHKYPFFKIKIIKNWNLFEFSFEKCGRKILDKKKFRGWKKRTCWKALRKKSVEKEKRNRL